MGRLAEVGQFGVDGAQAGVREHVVDVPLEAPVEFGHAGCLRLRPAGLGVFGETRAEVGQLIREGIAFHLEGLAEDGLPIPDPTTIEVEMVAL